MAGIGQIEITNENVPEDADEDEQGQVDEDGDVEYDVKMPSESKSKGPLKVKKKGRGFKSAAGDDRDERYAGKAGDFDAIADDDDDADSHTHAQRSVEGWIVICQGVHEEAQESDVYDLFADCGEIKQLHLNLDRRTGFVKGYALVEYGSHKEAQQAIDDLNNTELLGETITVDWAFKKPPQGARRPHVAKRADQRRRQRRD